MSSSSSNFVVRIFSKRLWRSKSAKYVQFNRLLWRKWKLKSNEKNSLFVHFQQWGENNTWKQNLCSQNTILKRPILGGTHYARNPMTKHIFPLDENHIYKPSEQHWRRQQIQPLYLHCESSFGSSIAYIIADAQIDGSSAEFVVQQTQSKQTNENQEQNTLLQ